MSKTHPRHAQSVNESCINHASACLCKDLRASARPPAQAVTSHAAATMEAARAAQDALVAAVASRAVVERREGRVECKVGGWRGAG